MSDSYALEMARDKTFEELYTYICTIIDDHFTPKTDVFQEINDVHVVAQQNTETTSDVQEPLINYEHDHHLNHVIPKTNIFWERNKFYATAQQDGESVTDFTTRIRNLSMNCDFNDCLEDILIDKFVFGLKAGKVKDRVCEEKPEEITTLAQVLAIAQAEELCVRNKHHQNNQSNGTGKSMVYNDLGHCEICGKLIFKYKNYKLKMGLNKCV